jgi:ribosomal RNA-processing protein 7
MSTTGHEIKGYLPVRLKLPPTVEDIHDETFFFVKEHRAGASGDKKSKGSTLFVANAPALPSIQTKLLLKSLFGRYGKVTRVTVVNNPRSDQQFTASELAHSDNLLSWTTNMSSPSFLAPVHSAGRFAHVLFESNKEMKKSIRSLSDVMTQIEKDGELPGVVLDKIEMQTLADETDRLYREEHAAGDDTNDLSCNFAEKMSGISAVVDRYRRSCQAISKGALMEECNRVMKDFEDAEENARLTRENASNEPDEEGFITVSHSVQVGSKLELESGSSEQRSELFDFYRFQMKDNRKRTLQDLRQRFEEDLARVKRMKEEKLYKPF